MNRQETVDALKSAAKNIGKAAVMSYLTGLAPWLRLPFINWAVDGIVGYILGVAIDKTEMGGFFLFIDVRTSIQGRAFAEAAQRNRWAQMHGTVEDKQNAERNLIHSFRALVRFTN